MLKKCDSDKIDSQINDENREKSQKEHFPLGTAVFQHLLFDVGGFFFLNLKLSFIIYIKFHTSTAESTSLIMAVPLRRLLEHLIPPHSSRSPLKLCHTGIFPAEKRACYYL